MNSATKQILYVAPNTARDLRFEAELSTLDPQWDVSVSGTADEALARIQETPFDAVVANDQLPDMDGFRLLDTIQQRHPNTHRLIVADLANPALAVKSAGGAHQCLPKPLDSDMHDAVLKSRKAMKTVLLAGLSLGAAWVVIESAKALSVF